MSRVPTLRHQAHNRSLRPTTTRLILFVLALVSAFSIAPAAQAGTPGNVTLADLCRAWSATTSKPDVDLSSGLNIKADRMGRVGSTCLASNAEVRYIGTKLTQQSTTTGASGTAASRLLAAVTQAATSSPDLKPGDELFYGAYIKSFNAGLRLGYFDISGEFDLQWTGGTLSRFLFKGRLYGVDKFNVTVYSPAGGTTLPNIGGAPVNYSGNLQLSGKKYTLNLTGAADSIVIGDGEKKVDVKNATIGLNLSNATDGTQRLHADVTGKIGVGSQVTADGKLSGDFDAAGLTSLSGTGALEATIPAKGSYPSGTVKGDATFSYTKDPLDLKVDFKGTVTVGDAVITNATGTLDENSVSFTGDATYSANGITAKGAVDGVAFYGDDLSGLTVANKAGDQVAAQKGDWLIKTASADVTAKGVAVHGTARIGDVGDDQWVTASGDVDLSLPASGQLPATSIKGGATIDWQKGGQPAVTFKGSIASGDTIVANAKGALDPQKIDFSGDVTYATAPLTVKGAVDGTVFYGSDLTGATVKNRAGTAVAATKGDFVVKTLSGSVAVKNLNVSGTASISRVGTDLWAKASGAVDATYNGTQVKGSADVDWVQGQQPTVGFAGSVLASGVELASASGTVDGSKITLKANGTLTQSGFTAMGAIEGLVYYGSDLSGQTITNKAGAQVAATKGDFFVKSASADLTAKNLAVSGTASFGKVGGEIWANGSGKVDATFGTSNLKGSATATWATGGQPAVTFTGTVTTGSTVIANASGTLDGNKIALKGDITYKDATVTATGAVEGTYYYGADLSGEKVLNKAGQQVTPAKGDWVVTKASGGVAIKDLDLTGGLTISSVGGQVWATASGSIDATYNGTHVVGTAIGSAASDGSGSISFDGTVTSGDITVSGKGTIDGKKITLSGTASSSTSALTVKGAIDGTVYYGNDLSGEKVTNRVGASVTPAKGDFLIKSASADVTVKGLALSGAVTIGKVGSDTWVKGGGNVDATYNGTQLKGSADFDWLVGTPFSVNYTGSVISGGTTIASASGTIDGQKITVKGNAQVTYNGIAIKGTADAIVYYGNDLSGVTVTNKAGAQVAASKGDVIVKSATADVTTKGLTITGNVALSKVGADVWATGTGSVDLTYGVTNLKGSATFGWSLGGPVDVAFKGTVGSGSTIVANATGSFDAAKITIKGDATYTTDQLTVKGAAEGTVYYGADLSGEKITNKAGASVTPVKGDFVLKSASVGLTIKGLSITGGLTLSSVAGDQWGTANGTVDLTYNGTAIKGSAQAAFAKGGTPSVTFDGTVTSGDLVVKGSGSLDGAKISVDGALTWNNAQVATKGAASATVYYGSDLSAEKVTNRDGAQVTPAKGDFVVKSASAQIDAKGLSITGAASGGKVGQASWIKGNGGVDTTIGGVVLKGTASFDWLVGTPFSLNYTGAVSSGGTTIASASGTIDGAKITVKGAAQVAYNGIAAKGTVDAVVYYGSDLSAEKVTNKAGAQVAATKGDLVVKSATAEITAKNLVVTGGLSLSKVGSDLWATGTGTVDLTYGATNLKGSATVAWAQGGDTVVTFKGTVTSGTTTVANASGTLDGAKIAIKGDVTYTTDALTVKGAADGVVYYGSDLSGEQVLNRAGEKVTPSKGDYVLKTASGGVTIKGLDLSGGLKLSSVNGDQWGAATGTVDLTYNGTNIKGTASADFVKGGSPTVTFDGTVTSGDVTVAGSGTIDGNKITIKGTGALTNANFSLKGALDGTVYYGNDLSGEKVTSRSGASVTPAKGDFLIKSASADLTAKGLAVSGAATIGKVGTDTWVKGGGSLDATYNGTQVKGTATIDWLAGTTPSVTFAGSVIQGGTTIASATGTVDGAKITLKGQAQVTYQGITAKGTVDAVVYYGSDLSGEKVTNKAGAQVAATKGDVIVKSATADVTAKGLAVTGNLALSKIGSDVWLTGTGTVDLTYGTTNLKGSATFAWSQGGTVDVTFKGTVTSGATVVANASGTLDGAKISLKGDATYTDSNLSVTGAVDGTVYYGSDLSGEKVTNKAGASVTPAKGDFVVKSASVGVTIKGLALTGGLTLSSVGGDQWGTATGSVDATYNGTNVKGTANAAFSKGGTPSVSFDGTITSGDTVIKGSGSIDGKKISLTGTATWSNAQLALKGSVDATVYYGSDLSGETVANRAGTQVQATKGDFVIKSASAQVDAKGFSLTGAVSGGSVGTQKWVKGGGSVDLTWNGTQLKGSANVDWLVGTTPAVTFNGSVISGGTTIASASGIVDGAKIALKGSAQITYSGITAKGTVDAVVYYGNDLSAEQVTNKAGAKVQATKGDLVINSATADVTAKDFAFTGQLALSKVGSDLWAKAGGSVDLTWNGTNIKGSANVDWTNGQIPSVSFTGQLTNGTTVVANAAGVIDGKKIALKGSATIQWNGSTITAAVDGVVFYGNDLSGETVADRNGNQVQPLKGDYLLKSASGSLVAKGLTLAGGISLGNVRGDKWATGSGSVDLSFQQTGQPVVRIQGQAAMAADGNVTFAGTITYGDQVAAGVTGTADGKKITFDASLTSAQLSGKANGIVYYGNDLSGETVTNQAGTKVQAQKGDFVINVTDGRYVMKQLTATANATVNKVGTAWWIHAAAQIKVGDSWLTFTGDGDSSGNVLLKGNGATTLDGYKITFAGQALVRDNRLVLDGNATIATDLFSVVLKGTIEKPNMNVDQYSFIGSAAFKFGTFQIADATVRLTFGEGLTTTLGVKTCFLFICPNATFKLYFQGGKVARAEMNAPVAWVAQFLIIGQAAMPGTPISTTITGIF